MHRVDELGDDAVESWPRGRTRGVDVDATFQTMRLRPTDGARSTRPGRQTRVRARSRIDELLKRRPVEEPLDRHRTSERRLWRPRATRVAGEHAPRVARGVAVRPRRLHVHGRIVHRRLAIDENVRVRGGDGCALQRADGAKFIGRRCRHDEVSERGPDVAARCLDAAPIGLRRLRPCAREHESGAARPDRSAGEQAAAVPAGQPRNRRHGRSGGQRIAERRRGFSGRCPCRTGAFRLERDRHARRAELRRREPGRDRYALPEEQLGCDERHAADCRIGDVDVADTVLGLRDRAAEEGQSRRSAEAETAARNSRRDGLGLRGLEEREHTVGGRQRRDERRVERRLVGDPLAKRGRQRPGRVLSVGPARRCGGDRNDERCDARELSRLPPAPLPHRGPADERERQQSADGEDAGALKGGEPPVDGGGRPWQRGAVVPNDWVEVERPRRRLDDGADVRVAINKSVRRALRIADHFLHFAVLPHEREPGLRSGCRHRQLVVVHVDARNRDVFRSVGVADSQRRIGTAGLKRRDDVGGRLRRRVDRVPGDREAIRIGDVVRVVVADRPHRMTSRQRRVPQVLGGEAAVDHLDQLIAREPTQVVFGVAVARHRGRMRDGDERRALPDPIDHVLLLIDALPHRKIEPRDARCAERELVMLAGVEAVLVRRQRIGSSFRGDLLVIGNRRDRVSAAAVRVGDLGVGLRCRCEPEPRSPVRVQVRAMPRMRRRSVRIVEMRSGEGARRVEPIRRGTRVRQSKNDRQRYEGGFEQEVLKLYTRRQASY